MGRCSFLAIKITCNCVDEAISALIGTTLEYALGDDHMTLDLAPLGKSRSACWHRNKLHIARREWVTFSEIFQWSKCLIKLKFSLEIFPFAQNITTFLKSFFSSV